MEIRGLTLWQPWASLVASRAKRYETRSWGTPYRGLLAIHAAARKPTEEEVALVKVPLGTVGPPEGTDREVLMRPLGQTYGKILCVTRLADCREMPEAPTPWEGHVGGFGPGRWGWELADVVPLLDPVPCKGARQLWPLPAEVLGQVLAQLPDESDPVPCPVCKRPMDGKLRCWSCQLRLCACGATISTPYIATCRACEVAAARREGVRP